MSVARGAGMFSAEVFIILIKCSAAFRVSKCRGDALSESTASRFLSTANPRAVLFDDSQVLNSLSNISASSFESKSACCVPRFAVNIELSLSF